MWAASLLQDDPLQVVVTIIITMETRVIVVYASYGFVTSEHV